MSPRTYLFVPGNRPERFAKALSAGADRVILDLEDAVSPAEKTQARQFIAEWLTGLTDAQLATVVVRINDAHSEWHSEDLRWLRDQRLCAAMLSKCETAAQAADVRACMGAGAQVLALVETAKGVLAAPDLAQSGQVARLAFGSIDFMLDLDLPGPGLALDAAAFAIALASRSAGLPAPIAGVTPALDAQRVQADWAQAKGLGFGAKMCIHPTQVAALNDALQPDAARVAWAMRVTAAWKTAGGAGAIQVDGQMVDKPVLLNAQRILAASGQLS